MKNTPRLQTMSQSVACVFHTLSTTPHDHLSDREHSHQMLIYTKTRRRRSRKKQKLCVHRAFADDRRSIMQFYNIMYRKKNNRLSQATWSNNLIDRLVGRLCGLCARWTNARAHMVKSKKKVRYWKREASHSFGRKTASRHIRKGRAFCYYLLAVSFVLHSVYECVRAV